MIERYCYTLDLVDDPAKIVEYDEHHENAWPEVEDSFRRAGIKNVELYRSGNRLFMIFEVDETFSFEKKARIDAEDPMVQKWEALMSTYQQSVPGALAAEKWVLMKRIYKFEN